MKLSDYKYPIPRNLIAKYPANPRDHARLLVINRKEETIEDRHFYDVAEYFEKGDTIVVNETKVFRRVSSEKKRRRMPKSKYSFFAS